MVVPLPRPDGTGYCGLAGYLTPQPGQQPCAQEVVDFLRTRLPEHMVPASLQILDQFPLTANGKVDRRALPAPDESSRDGEFAAPTTALQKVIAGVWRDVLGVERVGLHDDFFALGGDSLQATKIVTALREALDFPEVTLRSIFAYPTTQALAADLLAQEPDHERLEQVAEIYLEVEGLSLDEITSQL
ncbi:hypothetical protein GCM10012275_20040 [Longimycelium tulufanense]|uniref:Carrier domain-containing protein n=1 Tax=Longimycelium tulufanense TaxID=907463 RepID=A0A8J3CEL6_9PSEU|nr:phosphopantetheine-binding protein [Longimycelium tulufanense]GGM49114.1 hypothetical protein GCM10012275_20040 [Longimycelium tulufanense]